MKTLALGPEPFSVHLLENIKRGQEVLLTSENQAVAKVVPMARDEAATNRKKPNRKPGCLKGFWMADDFDAPLEEMKEYME
jgi:antitoxin (DNA-binding transcriptional repressor) of toxin-antitoxin stability system